MSSPQPVPEVLLIRARAWICALRIEDVIETFRPLPVQPVPQAPASVSGAAVVRGQPIPVVNLAALLGAENGAPGGRFVIVRTGGRTVALEVDEVIGVRPVPHATLSAAPPLLGDAVREHVDALGALDARLLAVLNAAHIIPDPPAEAPQEDA